MIGLHTALILLKVVFSLVNTGVYLIVNTCTFIYMHAREYFEFKFDGIFSRILDTKLMANTAPCKVRLIQFNK